MDDDELKEKDEEEIEESPADYIEEELGEVKEEVAKLEEIGKEEEPVAQETENTEEEPEPEPKEEVEEKVEEEPKEEINTESQLFKTETTEQQETIEKTAPEKVEAEEVEKEKEATWKEEESKLYPKPRTYRRKRGTIVYKDDNDEWVTVEPPYRYKRRQKSAPEGAYKTNRKAIQVVGGKPLGKTPAVDLGFAKVQMTPDGELITEYRQGGETGKVVREFIPQPIKSFTNLGLRKVELPQYRAGNLRVYLVNGDYVRRHYNVPFVGGGNDKTLQEVIPPNELWIEQTPNVNKMKKSLLYQLIERRKLEQSEDYEKAYEETKAKIDRIGDDINELDRSINYEVASNPEINMAYQQMSNYEIPTLTKEGGLRKKRNRRTKTTSYLLGNEYYLHHNLPETSLTGNI
jgi:chemotaxis protein histidine kinase CheA